MTQKKTKPGRPRSSPELARQTPFQIRLNTTEKRLLANAARSKGMQLSSWMRLVCLEAAQSANRR